MISVLLADAITQGMLIVAGIGVFILLVAVYVIIRCFHKVSQGEALIRNGRGSVVYFFSNT